MANGHGGYRRPSNPAPVSGPGKLSRRTDGQPIMEAPGGDYGDRQELTQLQQAAPLASGPAAPQAAPGIDLSGVVPLGVPSGQPDVPVTSGADAGAGPGMDALGLPDSKSADAQYLAKWLPAYITQASRADAPPGLVAYVKKLIAMS